MEMTINKFHGIIFFIFFMSKGYSQHIPTGIKTLKSENLKGPVKKITTESFQYFYNEEGYLYQELYFFNGKLSIKDTLEFDTISKKPIKRITKTKRGNEHVYTYKYNSEEFLIEYFQDFDKNTTFIDRKIKYEYDSLGRLTKEIAKRKKKETLTHIYIADSLIENIYLKSSKENFLFDKKFFDEKGQLVKKLSYTDLGLNTIEIYRYNQNNDIECKSVLYYSEEEKPCKKNILYKYDKYNNWIERNKEKRTIIYYE